MQIYLVGGAVRDHLLGLPARECDYVVVGATPQAMQDKGFRAVGKDFPVFLHPESGEEYALARTERKTGPGYHGFEFHTAPEVSLEEDLARRDLTINAIARDENGELVDPHGGQNDLAAKVLRHVSPAFVEDPVRVLRVARFAARFAPLGFKVAEETLTLMQTMVRNGEVDALVPERCWQETQKALVEPAPAEFYRVLRRCNALAVIFPEIERLFGVPQPENHHPEIDTGVHTLMVLEQAVRLSADPMVRFAALVHDLGKGITPQDKWPSHHGHEEKSVQLIGKLAERLSVPRAYRELAEIVARYHGKVHRVFELRTDTILKLLEGTDALRRSDRFEQFLLACEADSRGRKGLEEQPFPQADYLRHALEICNEITTTSLDTDNLAGEEIGLQLRQLRLDTLQMELKKQSIN